MMREDQEDDIWSEEASAYFEPIKTHLGAVPHVLYVGPCLLDLTLNTFEHFSAENVLLFALSD